MNFDITRGNLIVTQVQLDILNIVVRTCINIYLVEKCCKRMYFSYATRRNAENFNDTEREREREIVILQIFHFKFIVALNYTTEDLIAASVKINVNKFNMLCYLTFND